MRTTLLGHHVGITLLFVVAAVASPTAEEERAELTQLREQAKRDGEEIQRLRAELGKSRRLQNEASATNCSCDDEAAAGDPAPAAPILPFWMALPIVLFLVALSGLFSGLTLGLMGLDLIGLQIVHKGGNEEMAQYAARIMPIRSKGNELLCTLLLGNVAVNSALSILTGEIAGGPVGFVVSTALIVVFGEILPQAACSRYALQVGAKTVGIVKVLMIVFWILTKPLSKMLDILLGQEVGTIHSKTELMEMLKTQVQFGATDKEEGAMARQVLDGALCFRDKLAKEIMTPLDDAYMLPLDTTLGYDTIREIFELGFSRVPVYGIDKNDYRGLLYVKDLMLADPEDEMMLGDFIKVFGRKVECFTGDTKLSNVLHMLKKGGTHMGLVRETVMTDANNPKVEIVGVLTLEDIMEEILQEEIVDETDVYVDVDNQIKVNDGRESRKINLGVFNPVWGGLKRERLIGDEVSAISAHLQRSLFFEGSSLELSIEATHWLVATCEVQSFARATPAGSTKPYHQDMVFNMWQEMNHCILVLQGRCVVKLGRDSFRTEAGSFSLLGKDALRPGKAVLCDFDAWIGTPKARLLFITKERFLEASVLDKKPELLQKVTHVLAAELKGAESRMEARALADGPTQEPAPSDVEEPMLEPEVTSRAVSDGMKMSV